MFSRLRSRLTYANVMSSIAVFLALGGGAAYASHLIVRSSDIVDNEVRTADVRDDNLRGGGLASRDVRPNALTGSDVRALTGADLNDNSLTGADVNESTLGKVPDADKVDGKEGPLLGYVSSAGGSFSPDVVASQRVRTGVYLVQFARAVSSCHRVAALGHATNTFFPLSTSSGTAGEVSTFNITDPANPGIPVDDKIAVATRDSAGALADKDFLAVFC